MQLPVSQALALFVKSLRKINKRIEELQRAAVNAELQPPPTENGQPDDTSVHQWKPLAEDLTEELADAGNAEREKMRERQREMIDSLDLSK